MVDIYEISAIVAAAGVLVGVAYYILDMRNQSRVRQTDMVMRLLSTFGGKDFQEAWMKTMSEEDKEYEQALRNWNHFKSSGPYTHYYQGFNQVSVFFEETGLLLHRKLVDISLVDDLLSTPTKMAWEKLKPGIERQRTQLNRPEIFEWFEYLYNEMQKREQRK